MGGVAGPPRGSHAGATERSRGDDFRDVNGLPRRSAGMWRRLPANLPPTAREVLANLLDDAALLEDTRFVLALMDRAAVELSRAKSALAASRLFADCLSIRTKGEMQ
jgi:hypothetical protein